MKLCKDCKHFSGDASDGKCLSPKNYSIDPVTGAREFRFEIARVHRRRGWVDARLIGVCGKEARWFEQRGDQS